MTSRKAARRDKKEPLWIDERDALAIHDRVLAIHGGASGVRDQSLLESAIARPRQHFAYSASSDILQLATLYTAAIVRNHPFDGNKRTGFVLGILFLELNGCEFQAKEEDAAQAVLDLAAGQLGEDEYARWLRENTAKTGHKTGK